MIVISYKLDSTVYVVHAFYVLSLSSLILVVYFHLFRVEFACSIVFLLAKFSCWFTYSHVTTICGVATAKEIHLIFCMFVTSLGLLYCKEHLINWFILKS